MADRVLLLTGFGPFPGVADNPTAAMARALDGLQLPGMQLVSAVLPVAHPASGQEVARLCALHQPAAVLHLGVAQQADLVRIEQLACNELSFRVPDTAGAQPQAMPIDPSLPLDAELSVPWPVGGLWAALSLAGLPAALSDDAGRYVCNATFWQSLRAGQRALFVHVPPVGALAPDGTPWTLERLVQVATVVVQWMAAGR